MQRYVLGLLCTALGVGALHFAILLNVRASLAAEYWLPQLQAVRSYYLEQTPSPKILFVGGSSTLFGINALELEEALHRPCFNLGVHAGLRLDDILQGARTYAAAGDLVVVSLEPAVYGDRSAWTGWQLRNALAWNPAKVDALPFWSRLLVFAQAGSPELDYELCHDALDSRFHAEPYHSRRFFMGDRARIVGHYLAYAKTQTWFSYFAENTDERGDLLHTESTSVRYWGVGADPLVPATIAETTRAELAAFIAEMKSRQVRVVFTHTPYLVDHPPDLRWQKSEVTFAADLQAIGGELIDQRDHLYFPRELFWDSKYHLTAQGRELRTRDLLENLRRYLDGN